MKRGILVRKRNLIMAALIISLLFGAYNFFSLKSQQKTADDLFISRIQLVQSCFGTNYINNDDKNNLSITVSSNLHTALYVLNLTSYAHIENKNQLSMAINELYYCISETNTTNSRVKAFTEKSELINKYLKNISEDPNDKNSCEALFKISQDLRYNFKDVIINYEGLSPNWAIGYKIDGNENKHETYYTFKYIGKDAELVKDVNYSIDSSNEGEDGKFRLNKTKIYTGKLKLPTGLPGSTNRDITFKIKWNEKEEVIILKKSK